MTTSTLQPPTVADVIRARAVVSKYLAPTPALSSPALAEELGCQEVVLKCENLQPIGAFKIRGGIYYLSQLSDEERQRGVVTASTGNHAQSIAYAAREFGARAVIFVPEVHNENKAAATRALGAEVVATGKDFDEANDACRAYANQHGMRYIHPANEPWLVAGVGTYALELIEAVPELDVVIVPVGGGSGVCGTGLVFNALKPDTRIIAVQTENMPVVHDSYHQKTLLAYDGGQTWAEGLATRTAFEMPFQMMQQLVDDVVLVNEEQMRQAMLRLVEAARIVAEGAGAASLAAARKLAPELADKRVGLIVSGGNVTADTLQHAFCDDTAWA